MPPLTSRLAFFGKTLVGIVAGALIALVTFAVLHYVFVGREATAVGNVPEVDMLELGLLILSGAICGAVTAGLRGRMILTAPYVAPIGGTLIGTAVTILLGITHTYLVVYFEKGYYNEKLAAAYKAEWLIYGVPTGCTIGTIIGVLIMIRATNK